MSLLLFTQKQQPFEKHVRELHATLDIKITAAAGGGACSTKLPQRWEEEQRRMNKRWKEFLGNKEPMWEKFLFFYRLSNLTGPVYTECSPLT